MDERDYNEYVARRKEALRQEIYENGRKERAEAFKLVLAVILSVTIAVSVASLVMVLA